jgi:hypothetical protein
VGALEFLTESDAKAKADAIHAWLVANNPAYAKSAADGQTLRWAIPYASKAGFAINVKPRAESALSAAERLSLRAFDDVEKAGSAVVTK